MNERMLNPKVVQEQAPAKLNLALHVIGQRDDMYHMLDSLVVFAETCADEITCRDAHDLSLTLAGPEAGSLSAEEDNLVLQAARALETLARSEDGIKRGAVITLDKHLPIAAGIGGGSADAAATLRALNQLWYLNYDHSRLQPLAERIGADVPACLLNTNLRMEGIGERLTPVPNVPSLSIVLINPRKAVSTPAVFQRLTHKTNPALPPLPERKDRLDWLNWLARTRNDLLPGARALCSDIDHGLEALRKTGSDFATMSGSGATVFGIYEDWKQAQMAAIEIAKSHPDWWVSDGVTL